MQSYGPMGDGGGWSYGVGDCSGACIAGFGCRKWAIGEIGVFGEIGVQEESGN